MKKFLSVLLTLALALSLTVTAMAANSLTKGDTSSAEVKAKTVYDVETPIVYSVDIAWGSMEFVYRETGTQMWDPETHTYGEAEIISSTWEPKENDANVIQVTNHSNSAIFFNISFSPNSGFQKVTPDFGNGASEIKDSWIISAEDYSPEQAVTIPFTMTLSGTPISTPNPDANNPTTIGTITLTISDESSS